MNTDITQWSAERRCAYYRRRLQNQVFSELLNAFVGAGRDSGITLADLADRLGLGYDTEQVRQIFDGPSNLSLDVICDITKALDAGLVFQIDSVIPQDTGITDDPKRGENAR